MARVRLFDAPPTPKQRCAVEAGARFSALTSLRSALQVSRFDPDLAQATRERENREPNGFLPEFLGLASSPRGRALLEFALDREEESSSRQEWTRLGQSNIILKEVVIGGGLHAAVYAGTRVGKGAKPPLVIDQRPHLGGIFSLARRPVFYLNSRNRPENNGERLPGTDGPLNTILGGLAQVSDLSAQEYPDQTDLALAIRLTLIFLSMPLLETQVKRIRRVKDYYEITLKCNAGGRYNGQKKVYAKRVILATGIGDPLITYRQKRKTKRILTFEEFLEQMGNPDNHFPLKGYKKVAVVGANDSGRVVVEYLLGQGPPAGMSAASLDNPEQIFWVGQESLTKEEFETCERSRYSGIGRSMPRVSDPNYYYKVIPVPGKATSLLPERGGIRVRARFPEGLRSVLVDHVITTTGYEPAFADRLLEKEGMIGIPWGSPQSPISAKTYLTEAEDRLESIYAVGPAAEIPIKDVEKAKAPVLENIPENSVAIFRYAERTATLARTLN